MTPADFAPSRGDLTHVMHGLSIRTHGARALGLGNRRERLRLRGRHHARTDRRAAGRRTRRRRTHRRSGRHRLARARAARHLAPQGVDGAHVVDFGYQLDDYRAANAGVRIPPDWIGGAATSRFSAFRGKTRAAERLRAGQLALRRRLARHARRARGALAGLRRRDFQRDEHADLCRAQRDLCVSQRRRSPGKLTPDWVLKASVGRAVRMPTVSELYQGSIAVDVIVNNDPDPRSRRNPGPASSPRSASSATACCARPIFTKTRATRCIRRPTSPWCPTSPASRTWITSAPAASSWPTRRTTCSLSGLDLSASLTYAHSRIVENTNFPASVGKWQPRVPEWRANALATYRFGERWTTTLGARYSGTQYNTLDNSDTNAVLVHGHQPVPGVRCARALPHRRALDRVAGHRQPRQRGILGVPPLHPAHVRRGAGRELLSAAARPRVACRKAGSL